MSYLLQENNSTALSSDWKHLCLDDTIVRLECEPEFSEFKAGYGIICSKDGWILTCHNIVDSIENAQAKTKNEETFQVGFFHYDTDLDLAILKPTKTPVFNVPDTKPSEFKPFNYLRLDKFANDRSSFCNPILIISHEDTSKEIISSSELKENKIIITKPEVYCEIAKNKEISGCPIIAKIGSVIGMVNLSLEKENSSNSILGIASDTIKLYLKSIGKIWSEAKQYINSLNSDISMLLSYKVNEEKYEKELKNPQSTYYKYFDRFSKGIFNLQETNPKWKQMMDETLQIMQKIVAPSNSVNLEIHFLVKPKSFHDKSQTVYDICEIIHDNFSAMYTDFTFIDTSSVYIFEQLKWFLIWNSLLKTNEDKIKNMQESDKVIDVLQISQLLSEEEYMMIKQAHSISESVVKFVEVLSSRYPSDIDFIVAELQDKKLGEEAHFYNGLKINAMELDDPFKSAKESTSASVTGSGLVSGVSSPLCNV